MKRVGDIFERKWLTNNGPEAQEFEAKVAAYLGVKHCVAICNATVALEIAIRALGLNGSVIVPSYTFIATAHALQWQGITPIFCDIDPATHNIDVASAKTKIRADTTGVIGVHLWGRPCDVDALEAFGAENNLKVMYDAAHAFGATHKGRMVGSFGSCEVFSFHGTKFLNSFEGGAITTSDAALAAKIKFMRNFGFEGYDNVVEVGTNGKMTEVCAAMGLASLAGIDDVIAINLRNYRTYAEQLRGIEGVSLIDYGSGERRNYQYIVIEIDPAKCALTRDELVDVLHAENVYARKYFWPGCHRMKAYQGQAGQVSLPQTDHVATRVIVLPTGTAIDTDTIGQICSVLREALSPETARVIRHTRNASSNA